MTNETLGMSLRHAICEYYDIESGIEPKRVKTSIVDEFIQSGLLTQIEQKIGIITDHCLGSDALPKRGLHNFLNDKKESVSVRSFSNSKVAPKVVGQCGLGKFNEYFGHLFHEEINLSNIKELLANNTAEVIEILLDYLFCSNWNIFIYKKSDKLFDIYIITRDQFELYQFNPYGITLTKDLKSWNESTTIKKGRITIAEFQIHTNRKQPKLRLNPKWIIDELLDDLNTERNILSEREREGLYCLTLTEFGQVKNNAFGNSCEKALSDIFDLNYDGPANFIENSLPLLREHYSILELNDPPCQYIGSDTRERGGMSRSGIDFVTANGKSLSLKSNKSKNGKVCPSEIGQPSPTTFDLYFADCGFYDPPIDADKFRRLVTTPKYCAHLLTRYLEYTFECDYLIWTFLDKNKIDSLILKKEEYANFSFSENRLSFTNAFISRNSTTVRYNSVSIGEFQISETRNSLKFRFFIKNLIAIIQHNRN